MAQQQQAIHKFVLGSKEVEGKLAEFGYDKGWYSITNIVGEEREVIYKSRNAQEAYMKWNVYIGRKKERPVPEERAKGEQGENGGRANREGWDGGRRRDRDRSSASGGREERQEGGRDRNNRDRDRNRNRGNRENYRGDRGGRDRDRSSGGREARRDHRRNRSDRSRRDRESAGQE